MKARRVVLTPSIVTIDKLLVGAIDEVLQGNVEDREHRQRISQLREELRALVGDDAWKIFVKLDEEVGARISDLSVTLVAWAFVEGQRDGRRGGR